MTNGMPVASSAASPSISGRFSAFARRQSENASSTFAKLSSTRQSHMLFVVTQSKPSMSRRLDHVCQRIARKDAMDAPPSVASRKTQSSKIRLSQFMCMTSCTAKSAKSAAAQSSRLFPRISLSLFIRAYLLSDHR